MDTITVLLFLLLPAIFGLIGKKFEAAAEEGQSEGEVQPSDPMKTLAQMLGLDEPADSSDGELHKDSFPMPNVLSEDTEEDVPIDVAPTYEEPVYDEPARPEPVYCEPVRPEPVVSEVQQRARLSALKSQLAQQEEEKKQKEVIDPKKLVIYSEIMKPKYLE